MLQQTRVETVREYYRRWLREFPTLESLARAPAARVLKMWEGLGYYSRARNLHRAAKQISTIPATVPELMKLPGIGRYTAGAIASIAFDQRAPIVDGNVARVFARVFGLTGNVKLPATQAQLWMLAEELLPAKNCGDFNQALMELGALVCTPASPACAQCPLRQVCVARARGWQDRLPNRGVPQKSTAVTHDVLFIQNAGKFLLRQRPKTGVLAGMWEFPAGKSEKLLLTIRHAIMNQRITLRVFAGQTAAGRWFTRRQAAQLAMPAAHRRALIAVAGPAHRSPAAGGRTRR
ncbi:MAG: Adenine DNA glycosylase [Verrucomicrobiae bacterium]|nr:Adenine DNA glycosylase [Verrucomicrobiae bacterium]